MAEVDQARLSAAMARWSLDASMPVAETATSWVLRATSARGAHALKLLTPYGHDEIGGAKLMQYWAGDGAARIDAIHEHDVLMEWLDGATLGAWLRADFSRDDAATDVLCDVIAALHRRRPGPVPDLTPLDQWFAKLAEADIAFLPPDSRALWQRAQAMLAELLATTSERVPLHGDLHHDNVIGGAGKWRAIDPKGLIGDPVFDAANIFRNPFGGDAIVFRPERIERLATLFATRFGWPRRRVLQWACVLTAISAVWNRDSGNDFAWEMKMLPLMMAAMDRGEG